jgi:hypothetical protein
MADPCLLFYGKRKLTLLQSRHRRWVIEIENSVLKGSLTLVTFVGDNTSDDANNRDMSILALATLGDATVSDRIISIGQGK